MTYLLNRIGRPAIAFEAEGVGSGAGGADATPAAPATPESILFPKEGETKPDPAAGDTKADEGKGDDKSPAGDWKEYATDPAKSEAENAAAKAEHDKTKPAEDKTDPADKVPEDGKYALSMPDGVTVDQRLLDAVSPRFKELGLTTKQAQALTDDFIKEQQQRGVDQTKQWGETISKWVDDAKNDKDIGGTKWDGTVKAARLAVENVGTPALKEYLEATGGGNHPELIRFMAKVGAMIKEDNPADGGAGGSGKPADPAYVLFPNDAPKGN